MVYRLQSLCWTTKSLKRLKKKVWINETHMTNRGLWSVESYIHSYTHGNYSWIALKGSQTTPQSLKIKHAGERYICKSLWDPIVCLILYFTHPFPSFSLSCHLKCCVSSVVLESRCRDPSSSCCGESDYYNPTLPVHRTIIIIIISPNRLIIYSDAAAMVIECLLEKSDMFLFWSLFLI